MRFRSVDWIPSITDKFTGIAVDMSTVVLKRRVGMEEDGSNRLHPCIQKCITGANHSPPYPMPMPNARTMSRLGADDDDDDGGSEDEAETDDDGDADDDGDEHDDEDAGMVADVCNVLVVGDDDEVGNDDDDEDRVDISWAPISEAVTMMPDVIHLTSRGRRWSARLYAV